MLRKKSAGFGRLNSAEAAKPLSTGNKANRGVSRSVARGLFYSSILTSCLVLVNGATVNKTYAAACVGGIDGANGTVCFIGTTNDTLTYVGSNGTYVNGNFSLTLQNHDVNGTTDGITFNGVTGGDGFINLTGDSDVDGNAGSGINASAFNSNTEIIIEDTSSVTGSAGGIVALSGGVVGGNITITTEATTPVVGESGDGILANATTLGNVVVNAQGAVTGTGGTGIFANAAGGTVNVTTGAAAVTGTNGNGIEATASGAVTVGTGGNVTGTVGNGINAVSTGNGSVEVTTNGAAGTLVSGANGDGINADAPAGNVVVEANTAVTGSVIGIDANAGGTVSVTTGAGFAVTGNGGDGIQATSGTGTTVDVNGNVTGTGGNGILATTTNGTVQVTTEAGTLVQGTGGAGISASTTLAGNVTVTANSQVTGSTIGIDANAFSGSVQVTTGTAAILGQAGHGIDATGTTAVIVGTGGNVTGTGGIGINAVSSLANVSVTTTGAAGTLISGTSGAGINASSSGAAATVDVEVHTAVTGSTIGINAISNNGSVEVTTDQYAVNGLFGAGIDATASGLVTVSTGGNVTGNGIGINAVSGTNGNVNVTTNGAVGTLISGTAGAGIFANADGTGNTDVEIHTAVTGSTIGIDANADSGTVEVTTDTGNNVTGNAGDGIQATASGNSTVETKGNVTGTGGSGINAQSSAGGNVQVTTSLADPLNPATVVTGTAGAGILAASTGTGTVTIINDTFTKGSVTGIDAVSGTGAIQITNTRVISNNSLLETDLAIRTAGGPTTIDNNTNGGIIGRVETGSSDDTLNNRFFWITNGTSDFGAGANDAVNNFYYIFAGNQTGVSETTTFNGLENLNNNALGHIQLSDQAVGDGSNFSDVLRTSGNYNGNGGDLGVDAFLGGAGSVADVLSVGGNATGVTQIYVNDTNAGPGGYNPNGILVAHVDGSTTADNFVLSDGPIDKGLFFYDLLFDAANGDHLLVGLPD
ncbi:beta strand repeat-containing protein, partial [Taklimakanibacter albus]|nr:hypothetical protein [Aestuariivirga sp. YIM B02566]